VLVAANYRVGRFGFLAFPALSREHPDEITGNYDAISRSETQFGLGALIFLELEGLMIVEYTRYKIDEKRRAGFLNDYQKAAKSLSASKNCLAHELTQCTEDEAYYVLRIEWDSEEGQLKEFRNSAGFKSFFPLVKPYVNDSEEMRHYRLTSVAGRPPL